MGSSTEALSFLSERMPFCSLTSQAHAGELPEYVLPSVMESEASLSFQAAARILYRKNRRHLLVTGLKGVGKTSFVVELGRQAAAGKFQFLRESLFLWFDTAHVGPEDSRGCLETILIAAKDFPRVVLCLDGIHALLRRANGGSNKPLLRSALQDPRISVVGVLPRWEYSELFAADADLLELFDLLEIEEPEEADSLAIVESAAKRLSQEYGLAIAPEAVRRAVFLSSHFLLSERLPSKAIKILRQACDDASFERTEAGRDRASIDIDDIIQVTAQRTGIPCETLSGQTSEANWEAELSRAVVGQPRAISCVANELRVIKAGLTPPGKPASVLLFAGMTGVGKTELAKRLAELYSTSKRLQNYSMANFTEAHSVSGIVGVPAGYVGHDQGGRLINDLNSDPYSVFLLDEAEKAHPNVWKPFLNLFDEGWIVDQRGLKASADRAIFVLTTNAGSNEVQQMSRDGKSIDEIEQRVMSILSRVRQERGAQPVFPPQFLARIKQVVVFQPLDKIALREIAAKMLGELQQRWQHRRDQQIEIETRVVDWIGSQAALVNQRSGGREGGRAVQKLIANSLEAQMARMAARSEGGTRRPMLQVCLKDDASFDEILDRSWENSPVHIE